MVDSSQFEDLKTLIRQCHHCVSCEPVLPHDPVPIIRGTSQAKIRLIGQAPGIRAHISGIPFDDPSGVRLRNWLGVDEASFYNPENFIITPMGFCFPRHDANGGDLSPRPEFAPLWMDKVDQALSGTELTILIGMYAQKQYLGARRRKTLTDTVRHWEDYGPGIIPLPHPSWRNNGWLKKHDWFEQVLVTLKERVQSLCA